MMYDIIIIGCGPAGMTAALYAARANKKILILDGNGYGGQIINASKIENYPGIQEISGFDFATTLFNQIKKLGVEVKFESVEKINKSKEVFTNKDIYKSKSIIIATGVVNKKLGLDAENNFTGKGISYCATCDGNFYKNKIVAVIGGGNSALEDAVYLSNIASKVYLIHRRDKFRGELKYLDELYKKENVEFILNSNVTNIIGDEKLKSIEIQDTENNKQIIEIDGMFIAIGKSPQNEIFLPIVELDKLGYINSIDGVHTNVEGIYVAGDTRVKKLRQLTTAISDGAIAATTAIKEMK